jgi:hypothetical protein
MRRRYSRARPARLLRYRLSTLQDLPSLRKVAEVSLHSRDFEAEVDVVTIRYPLQAIRDTHVRPFMLASPFYFVPLVRVPMTHSYFMRPLF